jgi:hypothetical protein
LLFGDDQEAVEHPQPWARMSAGKHENRLVGVGEQHLLVFTLGPGVQADNGTLTRLNLIDHARAIRQEPDTDAIADRGDIALCLPLFEPPPQLAKHKTLPGLHAEEAGLGLDDQTLHGGLGTHSAFFFVSDCISLCRPEPKP